jgi:hypothetical protein
MLSLVFADTGKKSSTITAHAGSHSCSSREVESPEHFAVDAKILDERYKGEIYLIVDLQYSFPSHTDVAAEYLKKFITYFADRLVSVDVELVNHFEWTHISSQLDGVLSNLPSRLREFRTNLIFKVLEDQPGGRGLDFSGVLSLRCLTTQISNAHKMLMMPSHLQTLVLTVRIASETDFMWLRTSFKQLARLG